MNDFINKGEQLFNPLTSFKERAYSVGRESPCKLLDHKLLLAGASGLSELQSVLKS